jgi:hypothetical protein
MILIAFISVQAEVSSKQAEVLDRMVFTISIDDAHDCDLIIEALLWSAWMSSWTLISISPSSSPIS